MYSLLCCGSKKTKKPVSPGSLSADDMKKMLANAKRRNSELKKEILRLHNELDEAKTVVPSTNTIPKTLAWQNTANDVGVEPYSGWVKILRSDHDQSKAWRTVWAYLENGYLGFYQDDTRDAAKIVGVNLSSHAWQLHFRGGVYEADAESVAEDDLPHIIVLNVLDQDGPGGFYRLYINAGSAEAKEAWMRALELEICYH